MDIAAARQSWRRHWRDEVDAEFLYSALAEQESNEEKRDLFRRLADVERRHAERWAEVFREKGLEDGTPRPSVRARLMRAVARTFGSKWLVPLMAREEAGEVRRYLALAQRHEGDPTLAIAADLARDSVEHAESLSEWSGHEPWHHAASGDLLRHVVYGFNDGLTANFGLVAGIVGGNLSHAVVLLSGLAGMVADALSMGSSGYLASKSQQEVYAHEIEIERQELALMPDLEAEELALVYESKGLERERAREIAARLIGDPETALKEMIREELKISAEQGTPIRDGIITGAATAVGALFPVAPFLFMQGWPAMVWSFVISMLAHFGVGAARAVFTGRGVIRSGIDMFLVGVGVAVVSYFVGDVLVRWLAGP